VFELVWPHADFLDSYKAALARGWGPNTLAPEQSAREELAKIEANAAGFVASLVDLEAAGGDITLPNGKVVPRLPGYRRWIIERKRAGRNEGAEFVGSINLRRLNGTAELPPHVLGHTGYSVVPWKQRRGAASFALEQMIADAKRLGHLDGLDYLVITTDKTNVASQGVITKAGGRLVGEIADSQYGDRITLKYQLDLA
jgi:predicted acetyltransferase